MTPLTAYTDQALFVVRLIIGIVMVVYGWPKITKLGKNAETFVMMGFKPGWLWGTIIAIVEFFGGLAMITGFGAILAAYLIGFEMVVGTIWKITKAKKDFGGWSYDVLILGLTLVTITFGTGTMIL